MEQAISALLAILFIVLAIGFFFLFRNYWVFKTRVKLLRDSMGDYDRLPDYDTMLFKFWIWNVEDFLK